jgi:hypothetical protein
MRELLQNGALSVSAHSKEFVAKERTATKKNANLEIGVPGNESDVYPESKVPRRHRFVKGKFEREQGIQKIQQLSPMCLRRRGLKCGAGYSYLRSEGVLQVK